MNATPPGKRAFIDGPGAKLVAGLVLLASVAIIAWYHRADLLPAPETAQAVLNPEFVKCRDERTGQVDRMRNEGVISEDQHAQFKARAIAFCTDRFPPDQ